MTTTESNLKRRGKQQKREKGRAKWFSATPSYVSLNTVLNSIYLITEICISDVLSVICLLGKHQ